MTVRDAIGLSVLRRGLPEVLAGHKQLGRRIRWAHAGEVSNIASQLTGGEMLLTTGMGIGTERLAQRRFVERLAEKQLAALVIELGGAFEEPPRPLVEAAQLFDLPLIVLHHQIPFVAVTEAVHAEILSASYALLRRGEDIHRDLSAEMLDGDGIPDVLSALAQMLNAPVFLERGDALVCHAQPPDYELEPLQVWETARVSVDEVTVREAEVGMGKGQRPGRLLVADLEAAHDGIAQIALGHAADILALALLRERQEEELVIRERATFLADLADGRITPAGVTKALETTGIESLPSLLLPLAVELCATATNATAEWDIAVREAQRLLRGRGLDSVIGRRQTGEGVLGLVVLRNAEQRDHAADLVATALRQALERGLKAEAITIAIGRASSPETVGVELRLTEESAASAASLKERPWHDVTALELHRLLWARRDDLDLAAFVQRALGPLLDHDRRRKRQLLPTLEALLEQGGQKAPTARALHLNRQALYDRLARIEELLGIDLDDPQQAAALHVALLARRYVELGPVGGRL